MSLRFLCPNCGIEIIAKYLRIGDECKCRNCGKACFVPQSAEVIEEKSSLINENPDRPSPSPTTEEHSFLAGRGERFFAALIDNILFFIFDAIAIAVYLGYRDTLNLWFFWGVYGFTFLCLFIVQAYLLTTRGQTVGKILLNIKIVRNRDKQNGRFITNVLMREILNDLICIIPFYAFVDVLYIFSDDRRCIHDHIAGTIVVKAGR